MQREDIKQHQINAIYKGITFEWSSEGLGKGKATQNTYSIAQYQAHFAGAKLCCIN